MVLTDLVLGDGLHRLGTLQLLQTDYLQIFMLLAVLTSSVFQRAIPVTCHLSFHTVNRSLLSLQQTAESGERYHPLVEGACFCPIHCLFCHLAASTVFFVTAIALAKVSSFSLNLKSAFRIGSLLVEHVKRVRIVSSSESHVVVQSHLTAS